MGTEGNSVPDIGTSTPTEIIIGDTYAWTRFESDFDPSVYQGLFSFVNSSAAVQIIATDNGDGSHLFTITHARLQGYVAGNFRYQISFLKLDSSERYTVEEGELVISGDVTGKAAAGAVADFRTHAQTMLDAIEASIEGTAGKDQQNYTVSTPVGSVSIARLTPEQKIKWRNHYRWEVKREKDRDRIANGEAINTNIRVRF